MLAFPLMKGWYKGYGFFFSQRSTYIAEFDASKSDGYDNGWRHWNIDQERLTYQILIAAVLIIGSAVLLGTSRRSQMK
jgi:hypothetical protein